MTLTFDPLAAAQGLPDPRLPRLMTQLTSVPAVQRLLVTIRGVTLHLWVLLPTFDEAVVGQIYGWERDYLREGGNDV